MNKFFFSLMAVAIIFMSACSNDDEKVAVTRVTLNESAITLYLGGDDTFTLEETVMPANATDKSVTWKSDDDKVATVAGGLVTAKGVGNTVITVTTEDGKKTETCTVEVIDLNAAIRVISVTLDESELVLVVDQEFALTPTILPSNATVQTVSWTSSDPDVAFVSSSGNVTALTAGEATITATSNDNSAIKATCAVLVKDKETRLNVADWYFEQNGDHVLNTGDYYEFSSPINGLLALSTPPNKKGAHNYLTFEYQIEYALRDWGICFLQLPGWAPFDAWGGWRNTYTHPDMLPLPEAIGAVDPDNEALWKTFTYDLAEAVAAGILDGTVKVEGEYEYGNWAVMLNWWDMQTDKKFLFRNLRVITEE
jgi:hypothetical protein